LRPADHDGHRANGAMLVISGMYYNAKYDTRAAIPDATHHIRCVLP
jgi:hypothetical protein